MTKMLNLLKSVRSPFGYSLFALTFVLAIAGTVQAQDATPAISLADLSQGDVSTGLKDALSKGVQTAIANLGHTGGFMSDAAVHIPMPPALQKVDKALHSMGQGALADKFVASMNQAAEQAVPEAAGILGDSVKQMSLSDAKDILTGSNTAATAYFRRTSEPALQAKFAPMVRQSTDKVGVTKYYNEMLDKADPAKLSSLGSMSKFVPKSLSDKSNFDINAYVTKKALDGLFLKIADQEKAIRNNPVARTSGVLQQVFGAIGK